MIVLEQTESQPIMAIPKRKKEKINQAITHFVVKRQPEKKKPKIDETQLTKMMNTSFIRTKERALPFSLKTEDDFTNDLKRTSFVKKG